MRIKYLLFYVHSIQLIDKPQEYNQYNYYTIVIIPLAFSVGRFFCMILLEDPMIDSNMLLIWTWT